MNIINLFVLLFIGAVIFGLIAGVYQLNVASKKTSAIEEKLKKLNNFSSSNHYISPDGKAGVSIDDNRKKLCIIENEHAFIANIFDYRDILSAEIIEDGETITKTSRTSQIGGALLGTVLLGGVGAIIGGLSGSKKATGKVKSMLLRIVVNDTQNPDRYIQFLKIEVKKDHPLYKTAIENARKWHSILNVLIRKADMEDEKGKEESDLNPISKNSSIDKLEKLANLRDKGILTDAEFHSEKMKILNS